MKKQELQGINGYANSMFQFEVLHEDWLNQCTRYIRHLFPEPLKGKTVIDFAFGRGNWSVAFARAGANVIAIDASKDNVARFKTYCKKQNLTTITVIQGDTTYRHATKKADIIWAHGILHHLPNVSASLKKMRTWLKNRDSLMHVYFYDKGSIRQFVVESCRTLHRYKNENDFFADHYLFLRQAKNRASDDLVAPFISWLNESELKNLLQKNGLFIYRQHISFPEFLGRPLSQEFQPHHFICGPTKAKTILPQKTNRPYQMELKVLNYLMQDTMRCYPEKKLRKAIAIGLFNTHLVALEEKGVEHALREMFIYMIRFLIEAKQTKPVRLNKTTRAYVQVCLSHQKDTPSLPKNIFTSYLAHNTIRV